jgi:hypothetical protein
MDKFLLNVLTNPLSKDVIETKRTNLLKSLRIVDDDEYCPVTVGTSRNIVKSINREFFNNLLELPKVKKGYLADNPNILAFYMSNDNVIYINCKAIAETSRFLDKFSAVKIKGYSTMDVLAHFPAWKGRIDFGVYNVWNRDYRTVYSQQAEKVYGLVESIPAEGRTYGLSYTFNY